MWLFVRVRAKSFFPNLTGRNIINIIIIAIISFCTLFLDWKFMLFLLFVWWVGWLAGDLLGFWVAGDEGEWVARGAGIKVKLANGR
jgi:hypothetical protein